MTVDGGTPFQPTFRQRLEYYALSLAIWVIQRLPYRLLQPLAFVLGAIVYAVDRRGREVALANLDAVFGSSFTMARKRAIARASYQNFGRTMLELFWSPNFTPEFAAKIVDLEEGGFAAPQDDPSRPVIFLCLHYSNFEWLSQMTSFHAGKAMVVTQNFKNPLLGELFDRLRGSTGHEVIPQERAMIRMFKHLKKGGNFQLVVDLNLDPNEASVVIEQFGGLKTCVTQMHVALAQRTGAMLVPAVCLPVANGRYHMTYHPPLEYPPDASAAEIAQLCWNVMETAIRERPECWLWSYKHWRFKPTDEDSSRYPFYANTAKRFDKLLRETALATCLML